MTSLRPVPFPVDPARERALEAALDLSVALSSAGTDLLNAGGAFFALYCRDIVPGSPDTHTMRRAREAVERVRKALADFDAAGGAG